MPPVQSLVVVHGLPANDPPAHTSGSTTPPSSFIMPQVPVPIIEVNCSIVGGSGVPHAQAVVTAQVQLLVHTSPGAHPDPHGGSHASPAVLTPLPQRVLVQLESQPSPSTRLPSSHSSSPATIPSPQTTG